MLAVVGDAARQTATVKGSRLTMPMPFNQTSGCKVRIWALDQTGYRAGPVLPNPTFRETGAHLLRCARPSIVSPSSGLAAVLKSGPCLAG